MTQRNVVYTAVVGNTDLLRCPAVVEPALDYIVFSEDANLNPPAPWKLKPLASRQRTPRLTARWHKLHPHLLFPDCDASLYIDGNVYLKSPISALIDEIATGPAIALFAHPDRQCAYAEAAVVKQQRLDDAFIVDAQMAYYLQQGFPTEAGLFTATVQVRKHSDRQLGAFLEDWWRQVKAFSHRDQLSFNFMLARHNVSVRILPGDNNENKWFVVAPHRRHQAGVTKHCEAAPIDEIDWLRQTAIEALNRQPRDHTRSFVSTLASFRWYAKEPLRRLKRLVLRLTWRPPSL